MTTEYVLTKSVHT